MSEQRWSFFKDGDSSFGMFYPKNYTLAGFESRAAADLALKAVVDGGTPKDDTCVVTGAFLVEELESQPDASWLDRVKQSVAEFIGTETYFIDQDVALARAGGAFLLVYSPADDAAREVEQIIVRADPVYARRYLPMAIERLVEPKPGLHAEPVDTNTPDSGGR